MLTYRFSLLSNYRSALMGIAILGVMFAHAVSWTNNPCHIGIVLNPFARLVFTEGFLFLSGFGLFYSFQKQSNIKLFYERRVTRLLIPFMVIALPYYLIFLFSGKHTLWEFVLNETALYYFIYGNNGMWYISISILLYCLFPFMYKFISIVFSNK